MLLFFFLFKSFKLAQVTQSYLQETSGLGNLTTAEILQTGMSISTSS